VKNNLLTAFLILSVGACGVDTVEQPGGDNPGADGGGGGGGGDGGGTVDQDNRVTDQLQLLYKFAGVAGQTTVADVSQVGTPFDLTIADPAQVTWDGGGMTFVGPTVAANPNPLTKVMDGCMASNTISLEAWVKNATIETNGRILSSAINADTHNFALKQQNDYYEMRLRTSDNNVNGNDPYLAASPVGTATQIDQHIVVTRTTIGVTNFYVDGVKQSPDSVPGNFGNWDLTYGIAVGNEPSLDRPWLGTVYLLAVYCKELSQAEITQNYTDGY